MFPTHVGGDGNAPAFFSARERVFQSFCWSSSSCWCTAACSEELSDAHCASTLESGIALAADTVVVEAADEAAAWGGWAAAVARPRRTMRSAAEACIGGGAGFRRVVVLQEKTGKKAVNDAGPVLDAQLCNTWMQLLLCNALPQGGQHTRRYEQEREKGAACMIRSNQPTRPQLTHDPSEAPPGQSREMWLCKSGSCALARGELSLTLPIHTCSKHASGVAGNRG